MKISFPNKNGKEALFQWPHLPTHAILWLILLTSLLSWMNGHCSIGWSVLSFGLWAVYCLFFLLSGRIADPFFRDLAQSCITISVIMSLYFLLGHLGFAVIPWNGDRLIDTLDRWLGAGRPPVVWISNHMGNRFIEVFAFAYALFIPYLYLSIFLCLLGRSDKERPMFVTALAITYAVCFAGYLLIPAHGPLIYNRTDFSDPLKGGYFLNLVVNADVSTGGPFGAFPSLHVGASWLLCFFDLRRRQLRGMIYIPLVMCIAAAILVLRFHYVTDLIVGFFIATVAVIIAERIHNWPKQSQSFTTNAWRRLLSCYYGGIQVNGPHQMPGNSPILLLSNHSNAFIDPLILRVAFGRRLRLTAKAALLNNPLLAWGIRLFGIITFARIQDAKKKDRRHQNEIAFQLCFDALDRNEILCLFPEGQSHSEPSMLPLKSGAARLALDYLAGSPLSKLQIVAAGIFYEAKHRFGSRVLVEIGAPMVLSDWLKYNEQKTSKNLTEEFNRQLTHLTLNFRDEQSAKLLLWVSKLYQYRGKDPAALDQDWRMPQHFVRITQEIVDSRNSLDRLPDVCDLENRANTLYERCLQLGLEAEEISLPLHPGKALLFLVRELEMLTIGSLLFSLGILLSLPAILFNLLLVKQVSKDPDHWATNFLFFGVAILALWLILATSLLVVIAPVAALLMIPVALFSGYFSLRYLQRIRRTIRRARIFLVFLFRPGLKYDLQRQCRALIQEIDRIGKKRFRSQQT